MTNEIREKAIEAALSVWTETREADPRVWMRAAIDAYEKALWRPIAEAPGGESVLITRLMRDHPCSAINTYVATKCEETGEWICYMDQIEDPEAPITPTHFMPLPAPPEVG
jgi:hypothetical protein